MRIGEMTVERPEYLDLVDGLKLELKVPATGTVGVRGGGSLKDGGKIRIKVSGLDGPQDAVAQFEGPVADASCQIVVRGEPGTDILVELILEEGEWVEMPPVRLKLKAWDGPPPRYDVYNDYQSYIGRA